MDKIIKAIMAAGLCLYVAGCSSPSSDTKTTGFTIGKKTLADIVEQYGENAAGNMKVRIGDYDYVLADTNAYEEGYTFIAEKVINAMAYYGEDVYDRDEDCFYSETCIRTWLNGEYYESLPEIEQNAIADSSVKTHEGLQTDESEGELVVSTEKFFLPSLHEISGDADGDRRRYCPDEGKQLDCFTAEDPAFILPNHETAIVESNAFEESDVDDAYWTRSGLYQRSKKKYKPSQMSVGSPFSVNGRGNRTAGIRPMCNLLTGTKLEALDGESDTYAISGN